MSKENTEALAAPDELLPPMRMRLGATPAEWEVAASQARVKSVLHDDDWRGG